MKSPSERMRAAMHANAMRQARRETEKCAELCDSIDAAIDGLKQLAAVKAPASPYLCLAVDNDMRRKS